MAKVLLENVEIGMELSSDVIDRQGRVLLKEGVELTDKHIRVFETWGVLEIEIKGDVEQEENIKVYPPELVEEAEKYILQQFQHNDSSHPVIKNLMDYCKIRYMDNKVT